MIRNRTHSATYQCYPGPGSRRQKCFVHLDLSCLPTWKRSHGKITHEPRGSTPCVQPMDHRSELATHSLCRDLRWCIYLFTYLFRDVRGCQTSMCYQFLKEPGWMCQRVQSNTGSSTISLGKTSEDTMWRQHCVLRCCPSVAKPGNIVARHAATRNVSEDFQKHFYVQDTKFEFCARGKTSPHFGNAMFPPQCVLILPSPKSWSG